MYTQCPDCKTTFRITADVLKQAAGKVRCGGCGNAFNALEFLSESLPEPAAQKEAEENLPELKPEPIEDEDTLPSSISAAQSAALLKTLDELAGSDIRIEDTGVEWRVMEDDEIGDAADDESAVNEQPEDQPKIDELLDNSPTPVDQFLTSTPPEVDAPEIFEEQAAVTSVDELRFDDNTPIPENFEFVDLLGDEPERNVGKADEEPVDKPEEAPQVDFDLSEPEEWTDILDEFEDLAAMVDDPAVAGEIEALADDEEGDASDDLDDSGQLELIAEIEEFEDSLEDEAEDDAKSADQPIILPMSEEELTINKMIDEELLAMAVTDEDGFAPTIAIPKEEAEVKGLESTRDDDGEIDQDREQALNDTGTGFETIVMEGEHIHSAIDADKRDKDKEEAARLLGAAAAEREARKAAPGSKRNYGMIAWALVLFLLLAVQVLHQSRDALATIPAFNDVAGPVYRALGKPLSPEWDITGWRFEVTRGNADEAGENLTIYSRIGNNSEQPLPYPLIGISLTDRFEDVIGNRILDPADYLSSDLDPRKLVEPGNTFNAVISVRSPSAEATGFKLNVCYRESGGNLRCAIDDFK